MSHRQPHTDERIFGLDLLRAAAIMMVVLGHLTWILPANFTTVNILLGLSGFLGVEVFFVLSGFLIGRILYRLFQKPSFGWISVSQFLRRRWFRTLPNYFLLLLANVLIAVWVVGYPIVDGWKYLFFLQNLATSMPAFFPESWSLSVEEFAYLLLPAAFLVAGRFKAGSRPRLFLVATVAVYAVFILSKIAYTQLTDFDTLTEWNLHLKAVVIYRIDAICTGVIAAWISLNYRDFWYRTRWLAAFSGVFFAMLLIFGSSFLEISVSKNPIFWNVAFLPVLSIAIAAMLPLLACWKSKPFGIGPAVQYVSLISYAMYLVHYGIVMQLIHHFLLPVSNWRVAAGVYLVATVVLSAALYRFYEKPMTDLRDREEN